MAREVAGLPESEPTSQTKKVGWGEGWCGSSSVRKRMERTERGEREGRTARALSVSHHRRHQPRPAWALE
eukprot:1386321-Rhodomonas_salina.1